MSRSRRGHRIVVGLAPGLALLDTPYEHAAYHLPRESRVDATCFHFLIDLHAAFRARDWRDSSYIPLRSVAATLERDALGQAFPVSRHRGARPDAPAAGQQVSYRHFELHDLLCEALIALEAGNVPAAVRAVERAIDRLESDWLATSASRALLSRGREGV